MENLNKPAVVLANEDFRNDAKSAASSRGMPGIRVVPLTVPCECGIMELIEAGTSAAIDDIVAALTKPLTSEEKSPTQKAEELPRIPFKGNIEEVNRFYYQRGWTDGLPIIPPTEEAVREMLTGTDLPADHVVQKIIPRMGKATVEKIAINAVMAGALPTYMPVLIAGVQALMDPTMDFGHAESTTASYSPFWIINGPIRKDLNVNSGVGVLNPGNMANAVIGRAMGLIVKNIGGVRKGIEDMGQLGNPEKYTMVIAENEEASPWEPLHVEAGLNKEDSALTLFFSMGYFPSRAHVTKVSEAKNILNQIVYDLPPAMFEKLCVLIMPRMAKLLADAGWTKQEIKEFIVANARHPAYMHYYKWWPWPPRKSLIPPSDFETIPLYDSVERIGVVVCGGSHTWTGLVLGGFTWNIPGAFATKKVELPANWARLVEKYKKVVPTYVHY